MKKITFFLTIAIIFLTLSACSNKSTKTEKNEISNETKNIVQDYINNNISQLSPEPEVLGGTFYVTKIKFENPNKVTIYYEDGHIALQAEANFELTNIGVQINNFKLINNDEPIVTNDYLKCDRHDDCVPLPGCHSRECINKQYINNYPQPEFCNEIFDYCAAYKNADCICQQGTCFNENLMNPKCKN